MTFLACLHMAIPAGPTQVCHGLASVLIHVAICLKKFEDEFQPGACACSTVSSL